VDLGKRLVASEPVERLPDGDRMEEPVRERDRLGRSSERTDRGQGRSERRAHLRDRLYGHHLGAGRRQLPRQLPRSRRQVEDDRAGAESEALRE
jgi:hypothetical protein